MKICAIIPSYRHTRSIKSVIETLRAQDIPVLVIDDGNAEPARGVLAALDDPANGVSVHRLALNQGKGAAVTEGFRIAIARGYSHAVQVDADGQHDLSVLPQMIALAAQNPDALISGQPVYDASVPKAREIGRWVTHIWVWIETLSLRITDSMCGFRIYPLAAVAKLLRKHTPRPRMDFDTDIMVRLFWQDVLPIMVPVRVIYPPGNISNFNMLRDNIRISWMHTRLVCGMLLRLPVILMRRTASPGTPHWSKLAERGTTLGLRITTAVCKLFGKRGCMALLSPVILYFYLTGNTQRRAIEGFLTRALKRASTRGETFRVFMNFFERSLDLFLAWTGGIKPNTVIPADAALNRALLNDPRGGLLIVSHLGNANIAHALLPRAQRQRMTILAHTRHAANFNRLLADIAPDAAMNIFQVTEIGPETIIELKQRLESGARIVIAGDRTPVSSASHAAPAPFFGKPALFPLGPWVLASLLECPVHLLFCLKDGQHYRLVLEPFADSVTVSRDNRAGDLQALAARYADRLEHHAAQKPFQWYNFFDFWADKR